MPSELRAQWTASTSNLSVARGFLSAVTIGDNAIFAGGATDNLPSDKVDIYNNLNNTWQTGTLSNPPRYRLSATAVINKAIFAGGQNTCCPISKVDFFDNNAQYLSSTDLPMGKVGLTASSVGNKAFFAGGVETINSNFSQTIDVYNGDNNTWSVLTMTERKTSMASASLGTKVFFAGGDKTSGKSDVVEIYDTSNNTWSYATLSQARSDLVAVAVGSKVLFAGGYPSSPGDSDVVDIYDVSTNTWTTAALSVGRWQLAAATSNGKVFFGGGNRKSGGPVDVVDIYDYNSNTWSVTKLSQARYGLAATAVGNKVLFAGGWTPGTSLYVASDVVDIFEVDKLEVTSFSPASGQIGSTVTIVGNGFNSTPTNNIVYFGATKAAVTSASSTQLTVTVPSGATYQPITVTVNGLTAYSLQPFKVTFPSSQTITSSTLGFNSDFTTGTNPGNAAVGDLDGDGKVDLVVSNEFGNSISLFKNISSPGLITSSSFSSKVDFATGPNPWVIAVGDLDGDGKLDVAVTHGGGNTISVFRNTSISGLLDNNSFAPRVDFTVGNGPRCIAINDINDDGKPELVVSNFGGNSISVLNNLSSPGNILFSTRVDFATGLNPRAIVVSDINIDGKPDFIFSNYTDNNFTVLTNTHTSGQITSGSFSTSTNISTGVHPMGFVAEDINGDQKPEIIVTLLNSSKVSIFTNQSTSGSVPTFSPSVDFVTGTSPTMLNVCDIDGDAKMDLVVSNLGSNSFSILKNNYVSGPISPSSFDSKVDFSTPGQNWSVVCADLNGDSKPDVIVPNYNAQSISVFNNLITAPVPTITSFSPTSGQIGSTITIIGSNFDPTASNNIVYFGATKATVTTATSTQLTVTVPSGATYQPITVTVNGLTAYSLQPFVITFPDGGTIDGNSFALKVDFITGTTPYNVAIGDLDGDGKPDLVTANNNSNSISIFRNLSSIGPINPSSFATKVDFSTGSGTTPFDIAIGDLDGDGKLDLAVSSIGSNSVSVFKNIGSTTNITTGSFAPKVEFPTGLEPYGITIGDVDGDGKPELIAACYSSNAVSVLKNIGSPGLINSNSFASKVDFITDIGPYDIEIRDLDGDGKPDLAVSNANTNTISVLRNKSSLGSITANSFDSKVDFASGATPYSIAVGDIDSDEKPELVVLGNSISVSVLKNASSSGTINTSSFGSKVDFSSGAAPRAFSIGDLDGDAKLDIAVTSSTGNAVSILKNVSSSGIINSGSFSQKVDFITGDDPYGIAIGDLDGDGKPELVVANAGTENSVSIFRNLIALPSLISFSPTSGIIGASVTISGLNFSSTQANNTVKFNGTAAVVTASTATSITTSVPVGATTGTITVTVNGQTATSSSSFTVIPVPTITSFAPLSGPIGTSVTITGTNFDVTPTNNTVKFNGTTAVVTASTATSITTSVPVGATTGSITVTAYGQTATSTTNFTVIPIPSILSFTPSSGVVGTSVIITGTNFDVTPANNTVKFNGTTAVVTASTATSITTSVPNGATTGPIMITVNGQSATSSSNFTLIPTPTITSFNPIIGVVGVSVTITGTNFDLTPTNNAVKFNGVSAVVTSSSLTSITTTVPLGATTGPITVTVNGQTATSSANFTVLVPVVVVITNESFPSTYERGASLTLSITVNDTTNISSVKLKTRGISEPLSAQKIISVTGTGTKFEKTISSTDLTDALGLTYYFEVSVTGQGIIQSSKGNTRIKYLATSSEQVIPNMSFGNQVKDYQIISIPLELTNKNGTAVFAALGAYDIKKWRLFDYSTTKGDYIEYPGGFNTINIGKAYWLIVKNSISINPGEGVTANTTDLNPFIINLATGWNLIGNPYNFRISWSEVLSGNNNPVGVGKLKVFSNASLEESNTLDRYRGGFVFADAPFALKIPVLRNTSLGGRVGNIQQIMNPLDHSDWEVNLSLSDGELSNHLGGIGMNQAAKLLGKDQFDEVSLPLPNGFGLFELSFPHPEVFSTFSREFVPSQENYTWNFDIDRPEGGDLTMSWRNDYFGTNDKQLMLFNPSTQELVDMKKRDNYSLSSKTKQLRILYGSDKYIQHTLDKELPWLGSAYPNPAHEELTIPFRVPESYDQMPVIIRIYNSQGIEVGTPVNQAMGKGAYEIKWNPQGQTGLHIIRMRIGQEETKSIKMVFN